MIFLQWPHSLFTLHCILFRRRRVKSKEKSWPLYQKSPKLPPNVNIWTCSNFKICCIWNRRLRSNRPLTHSPLEILPKNAFWSLSSGFLVTSCFQELKLTKNPSTGCTVHGLLIQMQNIYLRSSGMHPLFFSLFLPHFFFSCWAFSRLHFGGKNFKESF